VVICSEVVDLNTSFICSSSNNVTVKELLKLVYIYESYKAIRHKYVCLGFFETQCSSGCG